LTPEALSALQAYDWPGNIRQVKNVAEWLVIMANGHDQMPIDIADLPPEMRAESSIHSAPSGVSVDMISLPLREAREVFERSYLQAQIARFEGSVSKTAQFVGMERSALHRKLKMLNVLTDTGEESDDSGLAPPAPDSERNVA
jgi:two-component system nitrogen regulation response regulator NtrX